MLVGIEIEEMPTECHECDFQLKFKDGEQDDWYMRRCVIAQRIIQYPRPAWCPLKEMEKVYKEQAVGITQLRNRYHLSDEQINEIHGDFYCIPKKREQVDDGTRQS